MGLHRVIEVRHLTHQTFSIRLERGDLSFVAGQCVNIGLPNTGVNREYSSYSGEMESDLTFLIRAVADGQVSPRLQRLQAGAIVEIDGAYGLFTLKDPGNMKQSYLFIGTGTGIAPFHSFVRSYPGLNYRIVHGIRHRDETYDAPDYAAGRYVSCVSQGLGGDFSGRVTDYLRKAEIPSHTICYLCGNRNMINEVYDILRAKDISGSHIVTEVFF